MKKYIIIISFILLGLNLFSQNIEKLLEVPWNTGEGIQTELSNTGNYGLSAFEVLNDNEVAFLCDVEGKVKIYNINSGELVNEFLIGHAAKQFTYDNKNNIFYFIGYDKVYAHCKDGSLQKVFSYNNTVIRSFLYLKAYNNSLYVVGSGQKTYPIIENGNILSISEQVSRVIDGRIINNGCRIKFSGKIINNISTINLYTEKFNKEYEIKLNKNTEGLIPMVYDKDVLFCYEGYLDENSNEYNRRLFFYSTKLNKKIKTIDIPNIYFTVLKDDIKECNGKYYHLITTPDYATLFEIKLDQIRSSDEEKPDGYPEEMKYKYHYNYHLPEIKEEIVPDINSNGDATGTSDDIGMRTEVLSRGHRYTILKWKATDNNLPFSDHDYLGVRVNISTAPGYSGESPYYVTTPPSMSTTAINTGMAYKWGGWTHYNAWDHYISQNKIIGDIKSDFDIGGACETSDIHVIGIDCSGFITQAWDLPNKRVCSSYLSDGITVNSLGLEWQSDDLADKNLLKAGDILLWKGHHVMLVVKYNSVDDIEVMESTPDFVTYNNYKETQLTAYVPRAMRMTDADYNLVCNTNITTTPMDVLDAEIVIENTGEVNFTGDIRISIYKKPLASESKEFGMRVFSNPYPGQTINAGTSKILNINDLPINDQSNNNLPIEPGWYYIIMEYYRDKGTGSHQWQQIPEAYNDTWYEYNEYSINSWIIKGTLYDDTYDPVPGAIVQASEIVPGMAESKINDATLYETRTDAFGYFKLALPLGWTEVQLVYPETGHNPVNYEIGYGDIEVRPNGFSYSTNQANYYSSISDGISINQCNDEIVYSKFTNDMKVYPRYRDDFNFKLEYEQGLGGWFSGQGCGNVHPVLGWFVDFFTVATINNDWRFFYDFTWKFQECDQFGTPVSSEFSCVAAYMSCDEVCTQDYVRPRDKINICGFYLSPGKYYWITLGDDDFGWTQAPKKMVYIMYDDDDQQLNRAVTSEKIYVPGTITAQNATISGETVLIGNSIKLLPNTKIYPGFKANNNIDILTCQSINTENIISDEFGDQNEEIINRECSNCRNSIVPCAFNDEYETKNSYIKSEKSENLNLDNHDFNESGFQINPNPTNGLFNISFNNKVEQISHIEIYNGLGKLVYNIVPQKQTEEFNLRDYAQGMYLVRVVYKDNTIQTGKVLLKK